MELLQKKHTSNNFIQVTRSCFQTSFWRAIWQRCATNMLSKIWVPKMVGFPNNPWLFLLKMIILGCEMGVKHHFRKPPYGTLESNGFTSERIRLKSKVSVYEAWLIVKHVTKLRDFPIQIEAKWGKLPMEHQRFEVKKVAHSEIIEKTGMMYL